MFSNSLEVPAQKDIFISWSGENSKEIAKALKSTLENEIFENTGLKCFVSDEDIASGDDWWNKIRNELATCKMGILCITKENFRAPWIYFEAGAMIARDVRTIPLLLNCDLNMLGNSPLKEKHCVDFYSQFNKMIIEINSKMCLTNIGRKQLEAIATAAHTQLKQELSTILKELKDTRIFNEKYIYPSQITTVKLNTLYISAPMKSISEESENDYVALRDYLLSIKPLLLEIGFCEVICALFDKESSTVFDGPTKAVEDNFVDLKRVDSMLVIYPQKVPSSVLVEIGYGIALSKRLVIFHKEDLPFILEDAAGTIGHVKTYKYCKYPEITRKLKSNGMHIFRGFGDG